MYVIWAYPQVRFVGQVSADPGGYVETYDPDARGGSGRVSLTRRLNNALRFRSLNDAMKFAHQVPRMRPRRADGQFNHPLVAAFALEFILLQEETHAE